MTMRFKSTLKAVSAGIAIRSFLNYVFQTLQYAGRGLKPLYAFSLHEPVAFGSAKCWLDNVHKDVETA